MAGSYLKRISSYDVLSDRVRNVIQMVTLEGRVKSWLPQREVQTLAPFSPSHNWPIVAQRGSECWIAGFTKLKKLLDSHPQNSDVTKVWGEGGQVSDYLTISSDEVYWCLNPDYKGSLTSAKVLFIPKPKFNIRGCCSFSISFLLPRLPGCTEAWCCMLWRAVWTVVMNIVPCLGSSQGGKWRGFSKPQPHVHGNPPQSHLILTPCLA